MTRWGTMLRVHAGTLLVAALGAATLFACTESKTNPTPSASVTSAPVVSAPPTPSAANSNSALAFVMPGDNWASIDSALGGNEKHGRELVAKYECSRCHEGTGTPAPAI